MSGYDETDGIFLNDDEVGRLRRAESAVRAAHEALVGLAGGEVPTAPGTVTVHSAAITALMELAFVSDDVRFAAETIATFQLPADRPKVESWLLELADRPSLSYRTWKLVLDSIYGGEARWSEAPDDVLWRVLIERIRHGDFSRAEWCEGFEFPDAECFGRDAYEVAEDIMVTTAEASLGAPLVLTGDVDQAFVLGGVFDGGLARAVSEDPLGRIQWAVHHIARWPSDEVTWAGELWTGSLYEWFEELSNKAERTEAMESLLSIEHALSDEGAHLGVLRQRHQISD